MSNENETLKKNNNALKDQLHLKETSHDTWSEELEKERDSLLVENKLLDQRLDRMKEENDRLSRKFVMIKNYRDDTESWKYIKSFSGNEECIPPLTNYGNSCYMNVVIQMTLTIFYEYFKLLDCLISNEVLEKEKIVFGFILLARTVRSKRKKDYGNKVTAILDELIIQFEVNGHNRMQTGYHTLVEELVIEKLKNVGSLVEDVPKQKQLFDFYRQLVVTKTTEYKYCIGCRKIKDGQSSKREKDKGTHVAQLYRTQSNKNDSIVEIIKRLNNLEVIDEPEYCDSCRTKKKWSLKNSWHDPPCYLQFLITHSQESQPTGLKLPWTTKDENSINKVIQNLYDNDTLRYVLVCICWRIEITMKGALLPHFFITKLGKDGQWYKVDDDTIEITTKQSMSDLACTNSKSIEKLIFMKTSRGYNN